MAAASDPPTAEQVLIVERTAFFRAAWPQGFLPLTGEDGGRLLQQFAAASRFEDRATAETRPEWKQLIPYCVLRRPGEVLCVQRKKTQVENRLHGMLSIGLGGHINPTGADHHADPGFFVAALWQELGEELVISPEVATPQFVGLLNDDSNAVGQVHVGLVYVLDLPTRLPASVENVRVREISKMTGGFRSLVELHPLWQDPGRFESWSRMLLDAGIAGTIEPRGPRRRPEHGREERNHG